MCAKRNLIIIGGGMLQLPVIKTALDMGLGVVVFDMSPEAPGMKLAHEKIIMSTRDIEGCARTARRLARQKEVHGVITAGTDASRAVAAVAGALDLPGIRYADAEAASNKVLMRKRLQQHGVPQPNFKSVWSLKEAREAADNLSFPLVLKPADNMGARGVVKLNKREEIQAAFRHSKKFSPTGEMILEEYMTGPELSVDALAWEGNFRLFGVADRIIAHEPYFVELGHNMPSALPREILAEAERVMRAGMRALGITVGAGKGDLKVTPDGVRVGEIAARLSGGFMSSHTYPLHSGINLLKNAILIALGESPAELDPVRNLVAIERGIIASPGKIVSISGIEAARAVPGIKETIITKQIGELAARPTSNLDKTGHIIAVGKNLKAVEAAVNKAREELNIVIDENYGVDWSEIEDRARKRFGEKICRVCKNCNGENCVSGIPGMGGTGAMTTFIDNSRALAELKLLPRYIREETEIDTGIELFGRKLELPLMAAPITGAVTNMGGALSERAFMTIMLKACREAGSIAWLGDGASPNKYLDTIEALRAADGFGVVIFKPRADDEELIKRFRAAAEASALAIGMDIDAVALRTMELREQTARMRNRDQLRKLRESANLPFVLKGIMTPVDAELALDVGADAIVVSNHGGRVLDDMPGTARVLSEIARTVGGRIPVLVDGGVRSGRDVFKMLALGAMATLVGRPPAIAAMGGEEAGVKYLISRYRDELRQAMYLCGAATPTDIDRSMLLHAPTVVEIHQ